MEKLLPALERIIDRYQVTVDKDNGITNNPNEWSNDSRYILDLVTRIVCVSLETMKIVKGLPALQESAGVDDACVVSGILPEMTLNSQYPNKSITV